MQKLWREVYGAGILFFYYFKWLMLLGYPALVYGLDYPRWWVMDALWLYCLALAIKDFIWKFILKRSYCTAGSCSRKSGEDGAPSGRGKQESARRDRK